MLHFSVCTLRVKRCLTSSTIPFLCFKYKPAGGLKTYHWYSHLLVFCGWRTVFSEAEEVDILVNVSSVLTFFCLFSVYFYIWSDLSVRRPDCITSRQVTELHFCLRYDIRCLCRNSTFWNIVFFFYLFSVHWFISFCEFWLSNMTCFYGTV